MDVEFSELSSVHKPEWERLATDRSIGHMHQCLWWAEPLGRFGVSTRVISGWLGGRLIGGALFRSIPIPFLGMHITECLNGPLFLEWRDEWAAPFLRALEGPSGRVNSITVAFRDCPNKDVHRAILDAALAGQMRFRVEPGEVDGVIPLQNRTLEAIVKEFNHGARSSLRKGQAGPLRVQAVRNDLDLYAAYETWMATAKRKGFSDVRPWSALKPVLRECIDSGNGMVIAAFHESTLVAAAFVTFIGDTADYVYGGYADGAESHRPNPLIQHFAIKESWTRGLKAYSLGLLSANWNASPTGVDLFKLSLGAVAEPQLDALIWERRPSVDRLIHWTRRQRLGRKLSPLLKRWLIARASGPPQAPPEKPGE